MARTAFSAAWGSRTRVVFSIGKLAAGQARLLPRPGGGARRRGRQRRRRRRGVLRAAAPRRAASGSGRRRASSGLHGDGRRRGAAARARRPAIRGTGRRCERRRARLRVAGFDLTFSAPKSVSVLFGLGDQRAAGGASGRRTTRRSREALGYLERSAAAVRRGHGGAVVEPADGLVAAAFRHRTSRAGDPQLHTHVLVANLGRGPGRALVGARWPAAVCARAGGELRLPGGAARRAHARRSGVEWSPVRKRDRRGRRRAAAGAAGVQPAAGGDRGRARASAGRRAPRAAEAAALATRRPQGRGDAGADELVGEWRDAGGGARLRPRASSTRCSAGSLDGARVDAGLGAAVRRARRRRPGSRDAGRRSRAATSSRRCASGCRRAPVSTRSARGGRRPLPRLAARGRPAADGAARGRGVPARATGGCCRSSGEQLRYSTPELLALEQRLIDRVAVRPRGAGAGVAGEHGGRGRVARAADAVGRAARDGRARSASTATASPWWPARPGRARRSRSAPRARRGRRPGIPVLGVAVARRAARELQDGRRDRRARASPRCSRDLRSAAADCRQRCVLVVDEAGMVPTRQLAELVDARRARSTGKLVLVGDHRQLPELEAGGAFRGLVAARPRDRADREPSARSTPGSARALDQLRDGRAEQALAAYAAARPHPRRRDRRADARAAGRGLVAPPATRDEAVMIAQRRADVADLNARAREHMRAAGAARGPSSSCPAARSRSATTSSSSATTPGSASSTATAAASPPSTPTRGALDARARRPAGRARSRASSPSRPPHGDPTLLHGYAMTGHVAQGLTVDHAFVLAGDGHRPRAGPTSRSAAAARATTSTSPRDARRRPRAEYAPAEPDRRPDRAARPPARDQQRAIARDRLRPASRTRPGRRFRGSARASTDERRRTRSRRRSAAARPARELEAARERESSTHDRRAASKPRTATAPSTPNRTSPPASNATPAMPSERPSASCTDADRARAVSVVRCRRSGGRAAPRARRCRGRSRARSRAASNELLQPPARLVDATTLATMPRRRPRRGSTRTLSELHAVRLGGERGRLRFDIERASGRSTRETRARRRSRSPPSRSCRRRGANCCPSIPRLGRTDHAADQPTGSIRHRSRSRTARAPSACASARAASASAWCCTSAPAATAAAAAAGTSARRAPSSATSSPACAPACGSPSEPAPRRPARPRCPPSTSTRRRGCAAKVDGVLGDKPIDANTEADYRWRLTRHLLPFFAAHRLDEIDRELCLAFKAHKLQEAAELREALAAGADLRDRRGRRARPLGPASIRKLIDTLAAILDEAVEDGLHRPQPGPRQAHARTGPEAAAHLPRDGRARRAARRRREQDALARRRRLAPTARHRTRDGSPRWPPPACGRATSPPSSDSPRRRSRYHLAHARRSATPSPTPAAARSSRRSAAAASASASCATCASATLRLHDPDGARFRSPTPRPRPASARSR